MPLSDSAEVFKTASSILGQRLRRVPDGETGVRSNWIRWQFTIFQDHPLFEAGSTDHDAYRPRPTVKLRSGTNPDDIAFGNLGYAVAAKASYAEFSRLKHAGELPADLRFQVSLPTPLAPITSMVIVDDRAAIEPPYEAAMLTELEQIAENIPHSDLAIQWDVAIEFAILEGVQTAHFSDASAGIIERLARLGSKVPEHVELGYHLCYGDSGHQHFKEPEDISRLTEIASAISAGAQRSIDWVHMPVPRDRSDEAYFAPLTGLKLRPETEFYLGLVHFTDGLDGTRKRIEAAQKFAPDFGVATECGFGRRPAETIPDLLRIHAEVSDIR